MVISAQSATSADRTVVLIDAEEKKMNRREVIKEYKNSLRPMGIVQVRNTRNNRVYLTASANTVGIEYHRLQVWSNNNKMIEKAVHP